MRQNLLALIMALAVSLAVTTVLEGQMTGHYPIGSEGLKAATLPPPGLYLRTYNEYYRAQSYRDRSGNNNGWGLDVDVFATVPRLIWMTDQTIFGATYGMDVAVPLVYTDFEFNSIPTPGGEISVKDNDFCFGDILVEPIDLAWHGANYDIGLAYGLWMPTGKYDKNHPASPGKDFWTNMFTFGGTLYFDAEKTWHASVLNRYEIHSECDDTDVRPGQNWVVEWGVGKTINKVWDVGVVGYAQWQLTDDSGSDVTWDKNLHDRIAAIGPEVSLFVPEIKTFISGRVNFEFSGIDHTEGTNVMLTLTTIF